MLQQVLGGGVQSLLGEEVRPHHPGAGLGAEGLSLDLEAAGVLGQASGLFGAGGGLAQGGGVAGAAGELAPDGGGFDQPAGLVLDTDTPGRHIGRLGLGGQKLEVQKLQQRGVAEAQAIARRGLMEEPLQLATDLEHARSNSLNCANPAQATKV